MTSSSWDLKVLLTVVKIPYVDWWISWSFNVSEYLPPFTGYELDTNIFFIKGCLWRTTWLEAEINEMSSSMNTSGWSANALVGCNIGTLQKKSDGLVEFPLQYSLQYKPSCRTKWIVSKVQSVRKFGPWMADCSCTLFFKMALLGVHWCFYLNIVLHKKVTARNKVNK